MMMLRHYALVLILIPMMIAQIQPVRADQGGYVRVKNIVPADQQRVRRNYLHMSRFLITHYAIILEGSPYQIMRLTKWLDEIYQIPHGRQTIQAIFNSGNRVTIRHSEWALLASGRTLAPLSSNLTNGIGEDIVILFDARIPDQGSHQVFNHKRQHIEFTATQNLFHELAHARHMVNGTWRYFDSEGQAIEEENVFRREFGERQGLVNVAIRAGKRGKQFWWPDR